jgi:hypothetical protein
VIKKIFILIIVLLVFTTPISALDEDRDYDQNTELIITGVVQEQLVQKRGPMTFTFNSNAKQYVIVTAPWWYMRQIGLNIKIHMPLEVTGSKFYNNDGQLYLILYSIKDLNTQKMYLLRNDDLTPLWRGRRRALK